MTRTTGPFRPGATALLALTLGGCTANYEYSVRNLRPIPAYWVDREDVYRPVWADYTFNSLAVTSRNEGWIVGNHYVLHYLGDDLQMISLVDTDTWLNGVDSGTPGEVWAGGFRSTRTIRFATPVEIKHDGVVWRWQSDRWEACELSGFDWSNWSVRRVFSSPDRQVWAALTIGDLPDYTQPLPDTPVRPTPALLHFDGSTWRLDDVERRDGRTWTIVDACFLADGTGWFVGRDSEKELPQPLALRRVDGAWDRDPGPPVLGAFLRLVCSPDGSVTALGWGTPSAEARPAPLVFRHDGSTWQVLELPPEFAEAAVEAIAAPSGSDVWLAIGAKTNSNYAPAAFLHWIDGRWTEVALPTLPEGRTNGFSFTDMQFVSADEGWAIANDYDGPGLVRGLIFHYKDGVWRNRNWSWHMWHQPWFGLFGD